MTKKVVKEGNEETIEKTREKTKITRITKNSTTVKVPQKMLVI